MDNTHSKSELLDVYNTNYPCTSFLYAIIVLNSFVIVLILGRGKKTPITRVMGRGEPTAGMCHIRCYIHIMHAHCVRHSIPPPSVLFCFSYMYSLLL